MKTKKIMIILSILAGGINTGYGQGKLMNLLKEELSIQKGELSKQKNVPYYMSYRVKDVHSTLISSSFGSILNETEGHTRIFVPQVRLGSKEFDNFKYSDMGVKGNIPTFLPIDEDLVEDAIREAIWQATSFRYKAALDALQYAKTNSAVNAASIDKAPCFSSAPVEKYYEEPLTEGKLKIDTKLWSNKLNKISAVFKEFPLLLKGTADIIFSAERHYFIDTDGTEIVQNLPYVRIIVSCSTKADDGMNLPLMNSYFSYDISKLADVEKIIEDTRIMAKKVVKLREAPVVDPYTGPVLLSGRAAGVFFHEIFGHRIEGQRMKNDKDGQTFKRMVNKSVLPAAFSVYDDPSLNNYEGQDLNGFYKFDDQGVKAHRVTVVDKGKLKEFLMTRTLIDGFGKSNGHARCSGGADPVSRQANLIIESSEQLSDNELRNLLLDEIKAQGKEYGFYFKSVTSGFTFTSAAQVNSFNVTPTEVYQVFADGRADRLVRGVDLIGTPLSMFSNISHGGGKAEVFTGMCGAESGWIPVTAIAPSILCNKVEMQRKAKSNDLPPLLSCPTK